MPPFAAAAAAPLLGTSGAGAAAAAGAALASSQAASRLSGLLPTRWTVQGLREYKDSKFQNWRPVTDFLDVRRIRKPASWDMIKERANANLGYYQTNYVVIFFLICIYSLMTSPFLLFSLAILAIAYHVINSSNSPTLTVLGNTYSTTQLNTYLAVLSIPLLWLGSAASTVFWIVGASLVVIGGHAALLEPPVERAFEESV
ncbi:PRA1 family protein-domain-containing protein [Catenaria anguillulae PL171]|uniref:PRA1 family protein n=1 Tax=Catenaria anguillulae PL171 TaxID=765915 RepID=A0A1Y2HR97_9FUNG|nr:PRA1 family protein-domain-containing protein [Catenaria anguillulae PL171]